MYRVELQVRSPGLTRHILCRDTPEPREVELVGERECHISCEMPSLLSVYSHQYLHILLSTFYRHLYQSWHPSKLEWR